MAEGDRAESPALGAAIPTAAAEMVHVERTIDPDPGRHQQYAFFMDRYTELYPQVKDVMHQMSRHVGGHGQR